MGVELPAESVRIVQVIGADRRELSLSADQAQGLGIRHRPADRLTVAYLLDVLIAPGSVAVACDHCGTSAREVVLFRRVGCERCYQQFQQTIARLTRRQSAVVAPFRGRIPLRLARFRRLFVDREALIDRLQVAVTAEDYETAASLRDQIADIVHVEDAES